MSRFLKTLARVGLVELDERETQGAGRHDPPQGGPEDLDRLLAETQALMEEAGVQGPPADIAPAPQPSPDRAAAAPPPTQPTAPPPLPSAPVASSSGQPLEALYAEHKVPSSPFPAEKMLRVLDGLAAMDPATAKAAVMAMDAADEDWTLSDPVLDAQRKIRVLQLVMGGFSQQVSDAKALADAELAAQEAHKTEATATIRAQIAEMEELLAQELTQAAEAQAATRSKLQAAEQAAVAETARIQQEIDRLLTLSTTFGALGS